MSKIKFSCVVVFFFSLLLLFDSCVPSKPVEEDRELSPDRLIKKLEANRRKIKTFEGSGVLNINTARIEAKANFEVLFKKPDSIKISIFGPFGIDLAQVLVTKENFMFFDVIHNELYRGINKAGILEKIMKINIDFDDLMDAFAGAVNLTDKLRMEPDRFQTTDDKYILTYIDRNSSKMSIYEIATENLAITNYQLFQNNRDLLFEGVYSDFKNFEGVPVPYNTLVSDNQILELKNCWSQKKNHYNNK